MSEVKVHRTCYFKWKNLHHLVMTASAINKQVDQQLKTEIEKNRALLERILDVTLRLASQNLPFCGRTKNLDDVYNGKVELLSHYDPLR